MGVTASVFCQDCRQFAPRIGDCGAIGFPSLKDTSRPATGDYQTFGYLKKGFDAIGYKPWELEAIAAYLRAHKGHDVSLYLEGSDVKLDDWDEDAREALADTSDTTEFAFDDEGFVEGLFEAACDKCGVSVRSGTERLRPFEPFTLKPAAIRAFMTRVRDADGSNFHRLARLLDYYNEQERLAKFLTDHGSHRPKVRIVHEDSWHADAGHAPPWKLAWQKPGPFPIDRKPLIAGDRVFAIGGPPVYRDGAIPPAVHCYSLDGKDLWKRDLRGGVIARPELTSEGLVVQDHSRGAVLFEMLCLDPADGAILSSRTTPYLLAQWFPGRRAFVGLRSVYEPVYKAYVGVVEWPSLDVRWEDPEVKGIDMARTAHVTESLILLAGGAGTGRSAWASCLDAAAGRERWTTSLAEFGALLSGDFLVWRDYFLVSVGGNLVALDLSDGRVAWQIAVQFFNWHESHDLLRGCSSDKFVAVDLAERKVRFAAPRRQFAATPPPVPEQSGFSVMAGDEILTVDQTARSLWALDANSGRPVWMHRPSSGVTGRYPAVSGDHLVIQGPTALCCYTRSS